MKKAEAKERLARQSIELSEASFIERIESSDFKAVDLLLKAGISPQAKDENGKTALMYAAERGDLKMIRRLMKAGASVESMDKHHATALTWAVRSEHWNAVDLMSKGRWDDVFVTRLAEAIRLHPLIWIFMILISFVIAERLLVFFRAFWKAIGVVQ